MSRILRLRRGSPSNRSKRGLVRFARLVPDRFFDRVPAGNLKPRRDKDGSMLNLAGLGG